MKYIFKSVFASEINDYLKLLNAAGKYIDKIQSTLRYIDKYLVSIGATQKSLNANTITMWLNTRDVSTNTKVSDILNLKGFVKYITSLGFEAECPELLKSHDIYTPYVFSDKEFERIILAADNFEAWKRDVRTNLLFPFLLRILFGCGLRLGEGRSLRWSDVDLENGVLTIKEAKNKKQRFVPMHNSLTNLLKDYRVVMHNNGICNEYLFESNLYSDRPFKNNTFYEWFAKILASAGINYAKHNNRERGPCPHCLRHCFTMKSFLKSENEGRRFENTAPFLAAYLGHDSAVGTEAYLSTNHTVYTQSHQRVDISIGDLFPEVSF